MNINVNDVNIFYEEYGKGQPIILLHGNSETHEIFDKLIEQLKENYKVYAIDSRCHGKSENTNKISYDLMSDDIISFIKVLKIEKPILYGFSDGGIIGILVAIKEPDILSKLIVSGANINPDGMKKTMLIISKIVYFVTKNKLFRMMVKEPNISIEELNKIKVPTIVIAGQKDVIKREHTEMIAKNIPNSILDIIPNENHGSYIIHSEKLINILKKYI
ncbi:MAG: alpha/beta fold hydrolase [Clostridia bacterium]